VTLRRVDVDLPRSGYEVCVGRGALSRMARSVRSLCGQAASRAFLVVDTGVP